MLLASILRNSFFPFISSLFILTSRSRVLVIVSKSLSGPSNIWLIAACLFLTAGQVFLGFVCGAILDWAQHILNVMLWVVTKLVTMFTAVCAVGQDFGPVFCSQPA